MKRKDIQEKMKKNKIALALIGTMLLGTIFTGCGKEKDETSGASTISISPATTMEDAENIQIYSKEGYILSDFTGEWIDEKYENKRALCIMINNISDAMPQSGIQKADITFEFPVEGGITRYMCVFQDYSGLEKLGPVRSARHYYVWMAYMLDAFYAHYGWSIHAEAELNNSGYENLNGLYLDGIMYYRDESRYAPHNVYTNSDMIQAGIDYMEYAPEHNYNYEKMFSFHHTDTDINNGTTANKVSLSFSNYQNPWFDYNADEKLYYRSQYGDKQIDDTTGEQLHYKNVLILLVNYTEMEGGLLDADLATSNSGYYISNGEYQSITWKRTGPTIKLYTEDGKELKMNPGNSFIEMLPSEKVDTIKFE